MCHFRYHQQHGVPNLSLPSESSTICTGISKSPSGSRDRETCAMDVTPEPQPVIDISDDSSISAVHKSHLVDVSSVLMSCAAVKVEVCSPTRSKRQQENLPELNRYSV